MSGGAETDFTAGYQANLFATWHLLANARSSGVTPRFIFASSIAVYGGLLPAAIPDTHRLVPQSSYGTQKAIGELLVSGYTRKQYIDGRSLRLPIIAVRPGPANTAVSSWASALVREPLNGNPYVCPVGPTDCGYILSHIKAIECLLHAHDSDANLWDESRAVMLPGLRCAAGEIADALAGLSGNSVRLLVRWQPDPAVLRIVSSWPTDFELAAARHIGFQSDASIRDIIVDYMTENHVGP